ncbi:MAG: CidA/LrgA family protein [Clostridia bacterium]|nr:CidA/LrgA family protein [Clostridia bacterium]
MKYFSQFVLIFFISMLGEMIHAVIPLPIPASVYGLVLLFVALETGVVKLAQVERAADLMIELMPLFFVPPGVSLMNIWGDISGLLLPFAVTIAVSTVVVMGVTGRATQAVMHLGRGGEDR